MVVLTNTTSVAGWETKYITDDVGSGYAGGDLAIDRMKNARKKWIVI